MTEETLDDTTLFEEIRLALLHPKVRRTDLVERLDIIVGKIHRTKDALSRSEDEARRYSRFYPEGSDGKNTFEMLANRIAEFANVR